MKYLWRFYWDCGRQGEVEGLFVATEEQINKITGKSVYFGEILGKHSEVYGTIEEGEITKIDISPEAVEEVSKHLGNTWSGYNPLEYIQYPCDNCDDDAEDEENLFEYEDMKVCEYCLKKMKEDDE